MGEHDMEQGYTNDESPFLMGALSSEAEGPGSFAGEASEGEEELHPAAVAAEYPELLTEQNEEGEEREGYPAGEVEETESPFLNEAADERSALAAAILQRPGVKLLEHQVSGVSDGADARSNMRDTAAGRPAKRSHYDKAPGGTVELSAPMLRGILALTRPPYGYEFRITAIAGGSHSSSSRHYAGIAFDVDRLQGTAVNAQNNHFRAFMAACKALGATEVLGPGEAGHATHVHAAWPRPATTGSHAPASGRSAAAGHPLAKAARQGGPPRLGTLSERHESNGNPGTVSTGAGDRGGVSYGLYQMTSKNKDGSAGGTVKVFVAQSPYKAELGSRVPGSPEFSAVWKAIAARDPQGFSDAQWRFIKATHYDTLAARLRADPGFDPDRRSNALQQAIWSTAVHHGPYANVVQSALAGKNLATAGDAEIITAIYAERGKNGSNGRLYYFQTVSPRWDDGLRKRFRAEAAEAIAMLQRERGGSERELYEGPSRPAGGAFGRPFGWMGEAETDESPAAFEAEDEAPACCGDHEYEETTTEASETTEVNEMDAERPAGGCRCCFRAAVQSEVDSRLAEHFSLRQDVASPRVADRWPPMRLQVRVEVPHLKQGPGQCYATSVAMAKKVGVRGVKGYSRATVYQIALAEDSRGRVTQWDDRRGAEGVAYMDAQLDRRRPVVVGISYKDDSYNGDKITDHFVLVTSRYVDSRGVRYYAFNDPALSPPRGTDQNPNNRFVLDPATKRLTRPQKPGSSGQRFDEAHWDVSMIRINEE